MSEEQEPETITKQFIRGMEAFAYTAGGSNALLTRPLALDQIRRHGSHRLDRWDSCGGNEE